MNDVFKDAAWRHNPAWVRLLGLCPLLAVTTTLENALGLAVASAFVVVGSAGTVSLIRAYVPAEVRLPFFVLVIATFTSAVTMLMQAYAFDLYERVALFVQIIVTNCMILGRLEQFASKQPVGRALTDALGTACGFCGRPDRARRSPAIRRSGGSPGRACAWGVHHRGIAARRSTRRRQSDEAQVASRNATSSSLTYEYCDLLRHPAHDFDHDFGDPGEDGP